MVDLIKFNSDGVEYNWMKYLNVNYVIKMVFIMN